MSIPLEYIAQNSRNEHMTGSIRTSDIISEQFKEIEGNNKMGKTRDLFKKHTKGIFYVKKGRLKDRNGVDLTEAEDIKKRWQEYTENCTKKIFMTQIIMMVCSLT